MTLCPWTGLPIDASGLTPRRGRTAKRFASRAARIEAHTAARLYTEHLIAIGVIDWRVVRVWYEARKVRARSLGEESGEGIGRGSREA